MKTDCADCKPCPHGKLKRNCAECHPCPHGKRKSDCVVCNPCPHGKLKYKCAGCRKTRTPKQKPAPAAEQKFDLGRLLLLAEAAPVADAGFGALDFLAQAGTGGAHAMPLSPVRPSLAVSRKKGKKEEKKDEKGKDERPVQPESIAGTAHETVAGTEDETERGDADELFTRRIREWRD